ncbi:hypothetical protein [Iodidimonas sp. SYSU 1G8]|uniref:hypothetical protein n=1 Tax=Iodidimonas sp. SYSU 1G8 TaxID=3133967 RepID=UPI0031FEA00E
MSESARSEARPRKVWADANGTIHKCEWLKVGDRKVPVAITLCGVQTPPNGSRAEEWPVTCEACNAELEIRKAQLVQA